MIWNFFIIFAVVSVILWTIGAWGAWRNRRTLAFVTTGLGLAVFFSYILIMWITLERPPLRTMGETRLWYSFFLPLAGVIVFSRWQYKWILSFSTLLATVFVCVNLFIYDTWHADGSFVGKGGMGTLLVMGPQRDMGCHHLACLFGLCTLPPIPFSHCSSSFMDTYHSFLSTTDVLVGN